MGRKRDEDEKELLFFISDEYENERDGGNRIVDPCHQILLNLLDRLLLTTAIFIAIVVCSAITCVIFFSSSKSHPHSYDITLRSDAPQLAFDQSFFTITNTIVVQNNTDQEDNLFFEWNAIELCNSLQRKSVLREFRGSETKHNFSKKLEIIYKEFLDDVYRNVSDILSPLDQISNCDINRFQPNIRTILPSNVMDLFPRDQQFDKDNIEMTLKLLASQYDEEDAIISIGLFPEDVFSTPAKCNYSINATPNPHVYTEALKRLSPFDLKHSRKACNTLTLSSVNQEPTSSQYAPPSANINYVSTERTVNHFEARFMLNGEIYDDDNLHSLDDANTEEIFFEFHMVTASNNLTTNNSYPTQSIKVFPGYRTNVTIDGCLQHKGNQGVLDNESYTNVSILITQKVQVSPWALSQVETMLLFGRIGYRLQHICRFKSQLNRKRSLEERYPNICEEITAINFKNTGESDIVKVVFGTKEIKVAPGTHAILAYIRDNIAILNVNAKFDNQNPCTFTN